MAPRRATDDEILRQIPAARAVARRSRTTAPHAVTAAVDARTSMLQISLTNGGSLGIPLALIPELRGASRAVLKDVRVGPFGIGVHWPALDVDLSVAGLAEVVLGRSTLLRAAGAAGGGVTSKAKADAARRNGQKGGRPRGRTSAGGS